MVRNHWRNMKIPETGSQSTEEDMRMFITIKYGNNESLLCNPSCAIVNLLANIKRRTGFGNTDMMLDLSDESGLVKDLDLHQYDYASKFLTSHGTYVLLEKQLVAPSNGDISIDIDAATNDTDGSTTPTPPQYSYNPLLEKCAEIFPGYKLHVAQTEKKKKATRSSSKSPSPAGTRTSKTAKNKPSMNRSPSKRR